MEENYPTISAIENLITNIQDTIDLNIKNGRSRYKEYSKVDIKNGLPEKESNITYWDYISKGDVHYFVGRILAMNLIYKYSLYCGGQLVENYLKAYLFFHNIPPNKTHKLDILLEKCKKVPIADPFFDSPHLKTIIEFLKIYNQVPRYPYATDYSYPLDAYFDVAIYYSFDYFVSKMREIIPTPEGNHWDILKKGNFDLVACQNHRQDFHNLFKYKNINFKG